MKDLLAGSLMAGMGGLEGVDPAPRLVAWFAAAAECGVGWAMHARCVELARRNREVDYGAARGGASRFPSRDKPSKEYAQISHPDSPPPPYTCPVFRLQAPSAR